MGEGKDHPRVSGQCFGVLNEISRQCWGLLAARMGSGRALENPGEPWRALERPGDTWDSPGRAEMGNNCGISSSGRAEMENHLEYPELGDQESGNHLEYPELVQQESGNHLEHPQSGGKMDQRTLDRARTGWILRLDLKSALEESWTTENPCPCP